MKRSLMAKALAGAVATIAIASPATAAPPPHHRPDGFQNNHLDFQPKGLLTLLQWRMQAAAAGLPKPPQLPTPVVRPDLAFIHANARAASAMEPSATWIGHATVLVQVGGINLLTDPIFAERASPVDFLGPRRAQPPGLAPTQLPHIDAVLISHNHYDHLDLASVKALAAQSGGPPVFVVPLGHRRWFAEAAGISTGVVELDWWQSHALRGPAGPVEIFLTPVQHWSARGLNDRLQALWGGFAVFAPGFSVYYAGDTGYSRDFADTRRRFADRLAGGGFDLALIPIGGYEPRWFMREQHVDPPEAVRIHLDLRARHSIGVHWGTFELTDESLDEAPRALAAALRDQGLSADNFGVLAIGQTRRFQPARVAAAP
jgi:N-acyl-phosphatidylethanolamine-hydrolysing phospholipase D